MPYKYRKSGYKYKFIYFYWQCFENLSYYFNKKHDNTWHDTWEILAPNLHDDYGLHTKCKTNHVCDHLTGICHTKTDKNGYNYHFIHFLLAN